MDKIKIKKRVVEDRMMPSYPKERKEFYLTEEDVLVWAEERGLIPPRKPKMKPRVMSPPKSPRRAMQEYGKTKPMTLRGIR